MLTFVIIGADYIYKRIAERVVDRENHRDQSSYEASLTLMVYKFTFWNSYSFCFILAFWERSVGKLA